MQQRIWTAPIVGVLAILLVWLGNVAAWEPQKPVELVIPAGPGGGADVLARFIAPLISKHNLSPQPFVAVNKSGGAGAEGFLYVKGKHADPHVIVITLSNLFTTPLATGTPFNWKDLTPLVRLALDEFILWVHAETPYTTAPAYLQAVKENPGKFKMGGQVQRRRTRSSRSSSNRPRGRNSFTFPSRVVVMWPLTWSASMSIPRSIIPMKQWGTGRRGGCGLWGSLMQSGWTYRVEGYSDHEGAGV